MNRRLVAVEMLDESLDATLVLEDVFLVFLALVHETNAYARIEKRQLAQPAREYVVVKLDVREGAGAGLEAQGSPRAIRIADNGERLLRLTVYVFLLVDLPVAVNREDQVFGQGVDDGYADTVQAAGHLVGIVVELTAGVQNRHDDFGGRAPFFRVQVYRDAAAVVADRYGLVGVNGDRNRVAVTRERLVDGVIDNLENHVVKAGAVIGIADVHAGPLAHGLKAF